MRFRRLLVPNADALELGELFIIAGVVTVLVIRGFLAAAGYPRLGGEGLHIAHVLWGGLLMALAFLILFSFLGQVVRRLSALLAGVGFGTFIDELGKFITSDNNYFYQPTIGIIYITFIAVFMVIRVLGQRRRLNAEESLANVFGHLEAAAHGGLDSRSKREVTDILGRMDSAGPLVLPLRSYVAGLKSVQVADVGLYFWIRDSLASRYNRLVLSRFFTRGLIGLFVLISAVQLIAAAVFLGLVLASAVPEEAATFVGSAQVLSSSVAAAMILYGAWQLRASLVNAYRWFMRAVLVNIFITAVFDFFESELAAVVGLVINMLIYLALRFMIEREESL